MDILLLRNFVKEIDRVAPWYASSEALTVPSWEKLGKDLDRKIQEGTLRPGTKAMWTLVLNCLRDDSCQSVIAESQSTLEEIQDSMSETERNERLGAHRKKEMDPNEEKGPPRINEKGEKEKVKQDRFKLKKRDPGADDERKQSTRHLYPVQEMRQLWQLAQLGCEW